MYAFLLFFKKIIAPTKTLFLFFIVLIKYLI